MSGIIHIATDEKFINNANWLFEKCFPGKNQFYIIVDNLDEEFIHVSSRQNVTKVLKDKKSLKGIARQISDSQTIVIHGLFYHTSIFVNALRPKIKVAWILFGKEFHENPKFKKQSTLYSKETIKHLYGNELSDRSLRFLKNCFRDFFYFIKEFAYGPYTEIQKASKKVDFLGILYREEFDHIAVKLKNNKLEFFKFSYYPIERMVSNINSKVNGKNILLGNSAHISGNHLDILNVLSKRGIGERKIICPLSYGGTKSAEIIKQRGTSLFQENFVPLESFMSLPDYNSYLEQCGIVIMNNFRQQALGNIMTMLWMGAKVFLDERNTIYNYLKRIKIHVFSIKKDLNKETALDLLGDEEVKHNRSVIISEIGQEQLQEDLKSMAHVFIS